MASLVRQTPWRAVGSLLSRGVGTCMRFMSTTTNPAGLEGATAAKIQPGGEGETLRQKHKTPRKKASSILGELRQLELEKAIQQNKEKNIADFKPGDSIEVKMVTHLSATEVDTYRGVVLSIRRTGADTRFKMADVVMGTPLLNDIPLYSPFIKSIKVLQPAYIHKGKKRVRRAKLYYLWEKRDPKEYTITG